MAYCFTKYLTSNSNSWDEAGSGAGESGATFKGQIVKAYAFTFYEPTTTFDVIFMGI